MFGLSWFFNRIRVGTDTRDVSDDDLARCKHLCSWPRSQESTDVRKSVHLFFKRRRGVSKNGEKRKKRQNGKKKQLLQRISTYEVLDAEMQKRKRRLTLREEISAQAQCKSNANDE